MSDWDDDVGYERSDPKHPDYYETWAGAHDNREKVRLDVDEEVDRPRPADGLQES